MLNFTNDTLYYAEDTFKQWRIECDEAVTLTSGRQVKINAVAKREDTSIDAEWYVIAHDGGFDCDGDENFLIAAKALIGKDVDYMLDDMVEDETNFEVG